MKIEVYTLNAFAKTAEGGNPAGVVLNSENLSEKQMLEIAKKVGFSETAFVQKSNKADFKVRFFTPAAEVDLCGHASIATFYVLHEKNIIKAGTYSQETKAGVLKIEARQNKSIFMNQNLPVFFNKIDKALIADSLNISTDVLNNELPVVPVSTGLKDIFIPVKSLHELMQIKPDFEKVSEISKEFDATGYHLFSLETKYNSTAHCRNLAPLYDIDEEAATGTSSGALSCFLFKHGILEHQDLNNLIFEQGYSMNRPSELKAKLEIQNGAIKEVLVGGTASNIKKTEVDI